MKIERSTYRHMMELLIQENPIVSILGPRQVGKTTLAHEASHDEVVFFDLEDPRALARLEQPLTTLESLQGLVVIDEIQRKPELFPILRVLVDRTPAVAKFLVLGSASPVLVRGISESLAGRVGFLELSGFDLSEVGADEYRTLWLRGGFPRSYLAETLDQSSRWRDDFVRSFLERDIPQFGISIPAATLRRFWTMVAHFHGQVWNAAEFARSLGTAEATARRYLDILTSAFMVRQLPPWFENIRKRQVKSSKIYVRDSGILHTLLSITSRAGLESHPKLGASWEGFAIEQVLRLIGERDVYFWATHSGAELDLLFFRDGKAYGVEIKYSDAPSTTKSMHIAINDLKLERLFVVYPGPVSYPLDDYIEVVSILDVGDKLKP